MSRENDDNYISIGSWMFMMFVTAIPVIGWIMVLVWAIVGNNQSRKNYFRAILAWLGVSILLFVILGAIGLWPEVQKHIQEWRHRM